MRCQIRLSEATAHALKASSTSESSHIRERPPTSSDRTAFCSEASNVRSIAITSPVAFICVPSERSPAPNLSKGQRGILVTT